MPTKSVNKSAVTGKFVSNAAVKRSPSTTYVAKVQVPKPKKSGK
jgi:hypothetical protein